MRSKVFTDLASCALVLGAPAAAVVLPGGVPEVRDDSGVAIGRLVASIGSTHYVAIATDDGDTGIVRFDQSATVAGSCS